MERNDNAPDVAVDEAMAALETADDGTDLLFERLAPVLLSTKTLVRAALVEACRRGLADNIRDALTDYSARCAHDAQLAGDLDADLKAARARWKPRASIGPR